MNRNIKPNDVEISIRNNSKYVGKKITFSQSRSSICNEIYGKYGIKQTLCFEGNNNLA